MIFNNCKGRKHREFFDRENAFFDLNTFGRQLNQATDVKVGETCVVAEYAMYPSQLRFSTFVVKEIVLLRDRETGEMCRVFCGSPVGKKIDLSRDEASRHRIYGCLLNKLKYLKRTAVAAVRD